MNLIAVDDVRRILGLAVTEIRKAAPDSSLTGFTSAREAIDYARKNAVDAAFLDISMVRVFLQHFLKNPVKSMLLGPSASSIYENY